MSTRPGLSDLEAEFEEAPLKVRKLLQLWKTDDYPQFLAESAAYLKASEDGPFAKLLLGTLRGDGRSLQVLLLKEKPLEADEALRVLSLAAKADPSYPVALLGILRAEAEKSSGMYTPTELIRLLELLQSVVDMNALLPVLTPLCKHPNKQLRSKAVLLAAGPGRKAHLKVDGLGDLDHRVRANAVEALWGECDAEAVEIFLGALEDSHHRVAGNGLYGLYRAGNTRALQRIPAMLRQGDPNRQMAAAWVMGKTADVRFLSCIESMVPVSSGKARSNLLHAARSIDERKKRLQAMPPLQLECISQERGLKGRVACNFVAKSGNGERLVAEDLRATDVIVQDGDLRVDAVRLEPRGSLLPTHVIAVLPARSGVDDSFAVKIVEAAEGVLQGKRPLDHWAVMKYEAQWVNQKEGGLGASTGMEFSTNSDALRSGPLRANRLAAGSLNEAMNQAILSFPEDAKYKAILVLRDKALGAEAQFESAWREAAMNLGVHVYSVFLEGVSADEASLWRKLSSETGGVALEASSERELAVKFRMAGEAMQGSFYLTYALGRLGPEGVTKSLLPVQMDVYTEKGYGSLRMLEE